MRLTAALVLALLLATAATASVGNVAIRDGRQATFTLDGVDYVIYDRATLARIEEAVRPQVEIGKRQAELGMKQAELGAEQAALGARQAEIGAQQAHATAARQRELAARQRELSEQQRALGARQRELGEKQRELGAQQRAAAREAQKKLDAIVREAVRTGTARRR